MNILVASSRQWHPEDEWIFLGIRRLMRQAVDGDTHMSWVLFDKTPDLLRRDGVRRRRVLHSNSFHHQTLIPFTMAVIAGSATWHARSTDIFYRLVARSKIPLFALGLGLPDEARALTSPELHCFKRRSTVITSRDIATKNYFRQYGIESTMLPCPSLFCENVQPAPAREAKPRVAFVIDDHQSRQALSHETFMRQLCRFIEHSSDAYDVKVICPTVNEFMRFAPMFGERTLYSYEAADYPKMIAGSDVVVTNNLTAAHVANAVGRVALFVGRDLPNELELAHMPFIKAATIESLGLKFDEIVTRTHLASGIYSWKQKIRGQWDAALPAKNAPIGPRERHAS